MKRIIFILSVSLFLSSAIFGQNLIQMADSLYELRGENFKAEKLLADSTNINEAIKLYEKALTTAAGQEKEEATWKLVRAFYFKGKYTTANSELKKKIYNMGKNTTEAALKEFPESVGINLFNAIVWGVWGEEYGILKAAKEGVAGKIKERCEKVVAIDPEFDEAGGYRVLGRVYFKAPKVWPILRWPSKEEAVTILEKGHKIHPRNLTTRQFLAEALYSQNQKARAIELMKGILAETETLEGIAEDAVIKNEVKATLKEWEGK